MKRQEPLIEAAESSFRAAGISDCFCREVRWEHVELSEVNFFKTSLRKMIQAVELSKRLGNLKGRGVVLKEGQTLADLYRERTPLYEKYADIVIDQEGQDLETCLQAVLETLEKQKSNC